VVGDAVQTAPFRTTRHLRRLARRGPLSEPIMGQAALSGQAGNGYTVEPTDASLPPPRGSFPAAQQFPLHGLDGAGVGWLAWTSPVEVAAGRTQLQNLTTALHPEG